MSEALSLKFDEKGLIPAIIQDAESGDVLMLGYMNSESLELTKQTGKVHFFSRSRQKLWLKGETSGHFQYVKSITADCDQDALLIKVEQIGAACHTGDWSCFHNAVAEMEDKSGLAESNQAKVGPGILNEVYDVICDRRIHPKEGSYTNYLFDKGLDKILKKVGEECAEVIIAAKNQSKDEIRYEAADLMFHLMVLLAERDMTPEDIFKELTGRRK